MYTEKRNFARLAMNAKASIKQDDQVLEGEVENLSMKGVFVTVDGQVEMDSQVAVTIYNSVTPQALCDLEAKVVRVTETGIGLQFEKSLLD
jgi:hypothetical protein